MEEINKILEKFTKKPYLVKMGAKKIAKRYHYTEENVREARRIWHNKYGFLIDTPTLAKKKEPKILILDIETAPMKAFIWKRWKENISLEQTISEWFMICWSAKWLGSNTVYSDCLTPEEILNEDDKRITKTISEFLDECDVAVAYNGCAFDFPKIQTRMIVNGIKPISAYKVIDPKIIAKKQFGFSSNKLDSVARMFGFDTKLETSFELWRDCMNGKQEALDYMVKYNQYDVELLEKVYLKIVPYAKGLPNLNVFRSYDTLKCPICGCEHLEQIDDYHTNTNTYNQYKCIKCGAISRSRKTNKINRNDFLIPL